MPFQRTIVGNMRTVYKSLEEAFSMDWRILIVLSPVLLAAGWALFNIGRAALQQVNNFLNREA